MKLKPHQRVSLFDCRHRALACMSANPVPASWVADRIWPDHRMTPQGAGAAASRILRGLEKDGYCRWTSTRTSWGWVLTSL